MNTMGYDDRGSGGRGGGGGGGFGRGPPREMHKAVCSDCGKEAQVPFKPTEGRPVYCRDCFPKHAPPRGPRY
jgi:CxxC-x17-CxxC domain-containing protein